MTRGGSKPCLEGCACRKHDRNAPSTYSTRHNWVRKARGKASGHLCIDCGEQARDWALIHGEDGESSEHYEPMCHSCHFLYDDVSGARQGVPINQGGKLYGKLTPEDVREIRRFLTTEMSLRGIARQFQVDKALIAKIRDRKLWAWLE